MPQEIYNEGRVVGLSAWELFLRNALANNVPEEEIPDENKWLLSMLGSGASMILKLAAPISAGIYDFELPQDSNLAAAGVITASPFMGECEYDLSGWATKVTSYSPIIQNDSSHSPTAGQNPEVPFDSSYLGKDYKDCVAEFTKITDGIVYLKSANWIPTQDGDPEKDIDPDFNNSSAVVRLCIGSDISHDVSILLTGFNNKRIFQGLSGFAVEESGYSKFGSTDTDNNDWANGGMLGPEIFPWASKIIFCVPNSALSAINSLERTIPSDAVYTIPSGGLNIDGIHINENAVSGEISSNPIVDFNSINLNDYYTEHSASFTKSPAIAESITNFAIGSTDAVNELVAWYPGMSAAQISTEASAASPSNANFFPPALYAAQIDSTGTKSLIPLDTAAPGTVKYFKTTTEAYNYKQLLPYNCSIYHDTTTDNFSFATNSSNPVDWPGTARLNMANAPEGQLFVGSQGTKFVALSNANGTDYDTSGSTTMPIVVGTGPFSWNNLLTALSTGACIDVYGNRFRAFANEIQMNNTVGHQTPANKIDDIGSDSFTLKPGTSAEVGVTSNLGSDNVKYATMDNGTTLAVGKDFIMFGNGLKLYISDTEPTDAAADIPIGSIGIGW